MGGDRMKDDTLKEYVFTISRTQTKEITVTAKNPNDAWRLCNDNFNDGEYDELIDNADQQVDIW